MSKAENIPVNPEDFSRFIEAAKLFERTQKRMKICLTNWYRDDLKGFLEDMRTGLERVLGKY